MKNSLNLYFIFVASCFTTFSASISPQPKFFHISQNACMNTSLAPFLKEDSLWKDHLLVVKECMKERRTLGRAQGGPSKEDYLLSDAIHPVNYLVKICPMVRKPFKFSGSVEIDIKAKVPTRQIELNMLDLNIMSFSLQEKNISNSISIKIRNINKVLEKVFFESKDQLEVGKLYTLKIEFNGNIRSDKQGLYKSFHRNDFTNKSFVSIVTRFQKLEARRMIPCFDEPRFRSVFNVILCREKSLKAVSNAPKISTITDKSNVNLVWDHFGKSPEMPTFLLAVAVMDDFEVTDCGSKTTKINVWAPSSKIRLTTFACRVSKKYLKFFEDYLNSSYIRMLPKLDLVPISDILVLGMENFGLPTFSMERLLVDENDPKSLILRNDAGSTISHEIIHMWFGNLISPNSWSYLWISESFAAFLSLLAVDNVQPEWQFFKSKMFSQLRFAMVDDSAANAVPIVNKVHTRDDLALVISPTIVYVKGCFIVRMISSILSADVFKLAMRKYVSEMQYRSISQDDLANMLTKVAHKSRVLSKHITMKQIIDSWTRQSGYPVVNVRRFDNGTLALSQIRFYQTSKEKSKYPNQRTKWWIPLTIATKFNPTFNDTSPKFWMNSYNHSWHLGELSQPDNWYVLNVQQMGYFRVNYEERNWRALIQQMRTDPLVFDEITRAHIVDDCFALANAKQLNYKIPYDILSLKNEPSIFVLNSVVDFLTEISEVYRTKEIKQMKKIAFPLLLQHYPKGGLLNRTLELPYVRDTTNNLIKIVCPLYQPCINEARYIYNQFTINNSSFVNAVDDSIRQFISNLGKKFSAKKNRTQLYRTFSATPELDDKKNYLHVLSAIEDEKEIKKLLNLLYFEDKQTDSLIFLPLGMQLIAQNPKTTQFAWEYLKKIWPQFEGSSNEANLFSAVVPYLWTARQYREFNEFIDTSMGSSSISRRIAKSFSPKIKNKILSRRLKIKGLKSWLRSRSQSEKQI